jgi:hypothetical protein
MNTVGASCFSILRQLGTGHVEPQVAAQYAMVADAPIKASRLEALENHADALRQGNTVPIGSVEFVRKAMALAGIAEPANLSYPEPLRPYLRRELRQRAAGSVLGHYFIKPTTTKAFTGFVFDTLSNPEHLCGYDRAQYNVFLSLPPETPVWVSEPVTWLSEFRYYVVDGAVRGEGRYDDAPDDMPVPDASQVGEMGAIMAHSPNAPVAFSLDVGVLDSGEMALVECNDAWALGYYKGTLSHSDYIDMLWRRWDQLIQARA